MFSDVLESNDCIYALGAGILLICLLRWECRGLLTAVLPSWK